MKTEKDILVSVCMLTYNHEKWLSEAIEGVIMQKANFPFELLIVEDKSTDNTAAIVENYSLKYSQIIRPFFNKKNLGLSENFARTLNNCRGKYVAICEGDDYWTDPDKLQKQVDFLEADPEYILYSHNYGILKESTKELINQAKFKSDFTYDQKRYLKEWVTQPVTCVFRNIFKDYNQFNDEEDIFCDVILFYELLKHGKGYFGCDNMAVFRIHENALSSGLTRSQWFMNHIIMFDYLFKRNTDDRILQKLSRKYCLSLLIDNLKNGSNKIPGFKPLKEYLQRDPSLLERFLTMFVRVPYYIVRYKIPSLIKLT